MYEVSGEKNAFIVRISTIVENLIQSDSLFQELDKDEIIKLLVTLFEEKLSPEQLRAIPDDELTRRIESIMMIEATAGMLNDLTPEEIEIFDATVVGRW